MDDFERLFALAALVSDPKTATENAKAMQAVKAERAENTKAFKEVKAAQIAMNVARQELEAGWKSVDEVKAALRNDKTDLDKERREVADQKASALADVKKARADISGLEAEYKNREIALKSNLGVIEKSIADASARKTQAESELEKIRKVVSA